MGEEIKVGRAKSGEGGSVVNIARYGKLYMRREKNSRAVRGE